MRKARWECDFSLPSTDRLTRRLWTVAGARLKHLPNRDRSLGRCPRIKVEHGKSVPVGADTIFVNARLQHSSRLAYRQRPTQ